MARALAHGDIVVEVAAKKGVKISVDDGSGLRECMESSSFQEMQRTPRSCRDGINTWIVQKKWYTAASWRVQQERLEWMVDGLMKPPMLSHGSKKDVSVQVSLS